MSRKAEVLMLASMIREREALAFAIVNDFKVEDFEDRSAQICYEILKEYAVDTKDIDHVGFDGLNYIVQDRINHVDIEKSISESDAEICLEFLEEAKNAEADSFSAIVDAWQNIILIRNCGNE